MKKEEIEKLAIWLENGAKLNSTEETENLEDKWSNWSGRKHSVFVNSLSSANFLMLNAISKLEILKNKKVVVSSLSHPSSMSSVIELGFEPLICDCNLSSLSIDVSQLESIFQYHKPSVLILTSVLGFSPDIDKIVELCEKHGVEILEDNTQSVGTEFNGKMLGETGLMSAHAISPDTLNVSGGAFVCTDNERVYNFLKTLRDGGSIENMGEVNRDDINRKWGVSDFDSPSVRHESSSTFAATEIQAFIDLQKMLKLDGDIEKRNENFYHFLDTIKSYDRKKRIWTPTENKNSYSSPFRYPMIFQNKKDRESAVKALAEAKIEVGPLTYRSIGTQPFFIKKYGRHETMNATTVDDCGIYVPNHPSMEKEDIEFICKTVIDSLK